jgi:hypothetical protein
MPIRLSSFVELSLEATRNQIRRTTVALIQCAGKQLVQCIGDRDIEDVRFANAEQFVQWWIDLGNRPATVNRHVRHLKRLWNLAIYR